MITIAEDGDFKVAQISASKIALFCTGGRLKHNDPMYITDIDNLNEVIENLHFNAKMSKSQYESGK